MGNRRLTRHGLAQNHPGRRRGSRPLPRGPQRLPRGPGGPPRHPAAQPRPTPPATSDPPAGQAAAQILECRICRNSIQRSDCVHSKCCNGSYCVSCYENWSKKKTRYTCPFCNTRGRHPVDHEEEPTPGRPRAAGRPRPGSRPSRKPSRTGTAARAATARRAGPRRRPRLSVRARPPKTLPLRIRGARF